MTPLTRKTGFAITAALAALGASSAGYASLSPSVKVVGATIHDLGTVTQGEIATHTFILRNEGFRPLHIEHVSSGCAYVATVKGDTPASRYHQAAVEVSLNTGLLSGDVNRAIRITTNDPRHKLVVVNLKLRVIPEFALSKSHIEFDAAGDGSGSATPVVITVTSAKAAKPLSITSTSPSVHARLVPEPALGPAVFRVEARRIPGGTGWILGNIFVRTSSSLTPVLRIPVRDYQGYQ